MNNAMKEYRIKNNYTQLQVAKKLGIAVSTYNMIENGKRGVSLQLAKKVSILFNASIDEIFFNDFVHNKQTK